MALEIAGSRVLAPYFGSTIFVWGSLIGVLLAALAIGYYLGGRLADRTPTYFMWSSVIGLAGFFILIIPFASGIINRTIISLQMEDRVGSLIASGALFFMPSVLLGMVSPFAIKFKLKNILSVGNIAGSLYAISALGSIFGTIFTAFYLINKMGVFTIFITLGITLTAVSIIIFFFSKAFTNCLLLIILTLLFLLTAVVKAPALLKISDTEKIIFQKDSFYNHIIVSDDEVSRIRRLRFDKYDQTAIYLKGAFESVHNITDMYHLTVVFASKLENILFIGGGGAVVPRNFYYDYSPINIDVVEIDPVVAYVSKRYFFFRPDNRLRLHIADGRKFIQKTEKKYDIIMIDVFNSASKIPFHMLTQEFFAEVKQAIGPDGVVALNIVSSAQGEKDKLFKSVYKTLSSVFENVYAFPRIIFDRKINYARLMNIILIATESKAKLSNQEMFEKAAFLVKSERIKISNLADYTRHCLTFSALQLKDAPLLTDDFAPVELMSSR